MSVKSLRVGPGLLGDPARPLRFTFDGRRYTGIAGDTLAAALLANGVRLTGRSFKYHRPRGIHGAVAAEPCALVDVSGPLGREPNVPATALPLYEGLTAHSQNRWPALRFDVGRVNDALARFLPAGFYYKTFMAPAWAWERLYEPLIRRAAGLGRLQAANHAHGTPGETVHDHADVLVVGAGAAGLAAAAALGATGLKVLLAEQDDVAGGGTLLQPGWAAWRRGMLRQLEDLPTLTLLTRTAVVGAYGQGVYAVLQDLRPAGSAGAGPRERLWIIRARRVVLATGAAERLIAFPCNDRPGCMLAGAAHSYLRRHGVRVGTRIVLFTNNDEAYGSALALSEAGAQCQVIDPRPQSVAGARAQARGIEVRNATQVIDTAGGARLRQVRVHTGTRRAILAADTLLVSGGYTPNTGLAAQLGAAPQWRDDIAGFACDLPEHIGRCAGASRGLSGLAAAAADGERAAGELLVSLGVSPAARPPLAAPPADPPATPLQPLWEVPDRGGGRKSFVDLQNDVTAADIRLACREGYEHIEHAKRYTTLGMATDQGHSGGLVGAAILAQARGVPLAQVGVSRPRPYSRPVPFAALAGAEVGAHFKPRRRVALHDWHQRAGATFVNTGLWLRPLVYGPGGWDPVLEEARRVRRAVGLTDVSTLGKIDVQGPDAARFLDFIYANTLSTLPVGRCRYGLMLREDGMLFDDGTVARLGEGRFLLTTTTANAAAVLEHMEFHLQAACHGMRLVLSDVADQWAQFALAGPLARQVLAAVAGDMDVSNSALPFMAAAATRLAGVAGRLFRISFSGELAYEIAVPAHEAVPVWEALLQAGQPHGIRPYGLDALNTLRIEKGHVTTAELNGNTHPADLGLGRLVKKNGDFIGRALLQRPGLQDDRRLQLVGLRPVAADARLRNGSQLVRAGAPADSEGFITSSTPSTELPGWVGLGLLQAGHARRAERLLAVSPIHGESTPVEVVSPHFIDPENQRVRA
ncbi:MAG: (2Fe-2S)-binding protein [Proteobacteria bacterium]|nr:(2Fe-2S)-binding protein [Pseudomonadota bacterium]